MRSDGMKAPLAASLMAAAVLAFTAMGQAEPPSDAPPSPPTAEPQAGVGGDRPIMLDTVRPSPEDRPPVRAGQVVELGPPERLRAQAVSTSSTSTASADTSPGRLVIYRTQAKTGWRTPLVSVDGVPLFRPKLNTYTDAALPPGLYRVRVDWARDTGWPDQVFDIRIAPGRTDHVRLTYRYRSTGPNLFELGSFAEWVAPEAAEAELRACCRRVRNEREDRR